MSSPNLPLSIGGIAISPARKPSLPPCTVAMFREADPAPVDHADHMAIEFGRALWHFSEQQATAFVGVGIPIAAAGHVFDYFAPKVREYHKVRDNPVSLNASVRSSLVPKLALSFLNDATARNYVLTIAEDHRNRIISDERLTHGDGIILSRYAKMRHVQSVQRCLEYVEAHEQSGERLRFLPLKQELMPLLRMWSAMFGSAERQHVKLLYGGTPE